MWRFIVGVLVIVLALIVLIRVAGRVFHRKWWYRDEQETIALIRINARIVRYWAEQYEAIESDSEWEQLAVAAIRDIEEIFSLFHADRFDIPEMDDADVEYEDEAE